MKTLWEKEKLLVTSNFSFCHSVFYPFGKLAAIFIKAEIVVCKSLSVWKSLKFVIWERVKRTGSVARQPGSGRPRTARSEANKDYTEVNIQSQDNQPETHKSQRKIGNAIGISQTSVHRITKELNLKAYRRIRVSRRDETVKQKRKTRSKNLDKRFTNKDVERMIITDEKDFTIEVARNRQNDVVYGHMENEIPVGRLYHETSRFSKKVMVSAGVSMRGKTRIHFIDTP